MDDDGDCVVDRVDEDVPDGVDEDGAFVRNFNLVEEYDDKVDERRLLIRRLLSNFSPLCKIMYFGLYLSNGISFLYKFESTPIHLFK